MPIVPVSHLAPRRRLFAMPADVIAITLPLPPSTNNLFSNGMRGRYPTEKYKQWRMAAGRVLQEQTAGQIILGPWSCSISVPPKMRGDIDNRAKAILDLLVSHGIVGDDAFCHRLLVERDGTETNAAIVRLRPYRRATPVFEQKAGVY